MGKATFTAAVHQDEDLYVALCSEAGTVSQGKTLDEAVENLKEATELALGKECELKYRMVDEEEFETLEAELMGDGSNDDFWDDEDIEELSDDIMFDDMKD
jgi:predicted RNase H-like HicB family nuclease